MRIYGRRGWLKLLPEYRTTRVLLEKELTRSSLVSRAQRSNADKFTQSAYT
jgi:hypothetical protein